MSFLDSSVVPVQRAPPLTQAADGTLLRAPPLRKSQAAASSSRAASSSASANNGGVDINEPSACWPFSRCWAARHLALYPDRLEILKPSRYTNSPGKSSTSNSSTASPIASIKLADITLCERVHHASHTFCLSISSVRQVSTYASSSLPASPSWFTFLNPARSKTASGSRAHTFHIAFNTDDDVYTWTEAIYPLTALATVGAPTDFQHKSHIGAESMNIGGGATSTALRPPQSFSSSDQRSQPMQYPSSNPGPDSQHISNQKYPLTSPSNRI